MPAPAAGYPGARAGAGASILNSKIMVPSLPAWTVPRPRLDRLITEGVSCPLTVLVGPPGSGKTLAMASWAALGGARGPVAWVSLDEFDNLPGVFWGYVMEALRQAGVCVPRLSCAAYADGADHQFLVRLASELAGRNPPVILVLDDLQLLTRTTALQELTYILRNAQQGLHLMVASRMDPPLPLHRFRLTGEIAEIRGGDLAFSVPESGLLMAQHGIALPPESLECLTRQAEGWAAGLRMAAISMNGRPDPEQFVKEFLAEDSAVVSYLVEEALNAHPPHLRDLLLRTSILDSFDAELAGELCGEAAGNSLPDLARANAFVHPSGNGWYRYHALFADVLRLKLRHERPELVPGLHRQAAGWYQRNGSLLPAVRHAAKAGDWPLAARFVVDELAVGQLIGPHRDQPLTGEFERMPYTWTWATPEPFLVAAALELAEDHPGGSWLRAAEQMISQLPAEETVFARLAAGQIRLALARRTGDLESAATAAGEAELLLAAVPAGVLARHPLLRSRALADRGIVEFWRGRLGEAAAAFEAAIAAVPAPDGTYERADCLGYLALAGALSGRLNRATAMAAEALGTPTGAGGRLPMRISPAAHLAMAAVHVERNEPHQADERLKRVEAALRRHPDKMIAAVACLVAARKALAGGNPGTSLQIVRQAGQGGQLPAWLGRRLALLESRACAAAGDTRSALAAAERAGPATLDATVAVASAWLAAGDLHTAKDALTSYQEGAKAVADQARLEAWLAAAQISYGSGDRADGRRSLQRALRLGEPQRLRLPFVLAGTWLRHVLQADPDLAQAYQGLLGPELAGPERETAPRAGPNPAAPVLLEPLTGREREVLQHASGMLDTTEIAGALFISVNTVKSHFKSIYRKLAVTHRTEAVRRAQQLHLI